MDLILVSFHANAWSWFHNPTIHPWCYFLSHWRYLKPDSRFWFLTWHCLHSFSGTNFIKIIRIHSELCTGIILPHSTLILISGWSELGKQLQATFSRGTWEKRREDQGACSSRMLVLLLGDVMEIAWTFVSSISTSNISWKICVFTYVDKTQRIITKSASQSVFSCCIDIQILESVWKQRCHRGNSTSSFWIILQDRKNRELYFLSL